MSPALHVLTDSRTPRWVRHLIASLERFGITPDNSDAAGSAQILDLRRASTREASPQDGWTLEIGYERGGIPAFDEALRGSDVVEVRLVLRSAGESYAVRSGCFPYASSHARTLERVAHQCARWIAGELQAPTPIASAPCVEKKIVAAPSVLERTRFAVREIVRRTQHALRFAFEEVRWDVAVANIPLESFIENPHAAWLHWVARDEREFLADPFVAPGHDGGPRLLCETLEQRRPRIVSIDLNDRFGERTPLLDEGAPSSYPFTFELNGETWVTPEQYRSRSVRAYRLNGGVHPVQWPIFEGIAAVDPSIVHYHGLWWLFCTDEDDAPNYALRIFWSHHPTGPWHPHARNPAKIDITGARPAGSFFLRDGLLHRPSQDCSRRYGRALSIQRIDALTPSEFSETCVARIDASLVRRRSAVGVHTLSYGEGWVALDAQFARWSLRKPLRLLRERTGERNV